MNMFAGRQRWAQRAWTREAAQLASSSFLRGWREGGSVMARPAPFAFS